MEEKRIKGYKAFNADFTNNYGYHFDEARVNSVSGRATFGTSGNGYHFCERLEDTLRYFDAMNGDVLFAEVIGSGDIHEGSDEYYGYYDMYAATNLEIVRVLDRQDIIEMFSDVAWYRMVRFVQGFRLTEEEIVRFKEIYANEEDVLKAIAYYQEGKKDTFELKNAYKFTRKYPIINTD